MHFVYVLRSSKNPKRLYIGCTKDIEKRLNDHNRGDTAYSKVYAPWNLEMYLAFKHRQLALAFEKYLKSGSGHAFMKKRLLPSVTR